MTQGAPSPALSTTPQRSKRGLLIALAALVLAAAAGIAWKTLGSAAGDASYRFAKVERGNVTSVVSASGSLSAVTTVLVGSQISGQIKELFVDFNSQVKKGQLLARIDPETFELKVRQSEADLEAARTQFLNQQANLLTLRSQATRTRIQANDAKNDLDRKESLFAKGFISGAERDKARFTYDAAAEAVTTAEAQIRAGEAQIANAAAIVKQREAAWPAPASTCRARRSSRRSTASSSRARSMRGRRWRRASTRRRCSRSRRICARCRSRRRSTSPTSARSSPASASPSRSTPTRRGPSKATCGRSARRRRRCRTSSPTRSSWRPRTPACCWCRE